LKSELCLKHSSLTRGRGRSTLYYMNGINHKSNWMKGLIKNELDEMAGYTIKYSLPGLLYHSKK